MKPKLAVLISGRGSNLQAVLDASKMVGFPGEVAVVISNRRDAYGLERARKAGVEALWIPHRKKTREEHEKEVIASLEKRGVQWICLAGYMRVLTPLFLDAFPNRIINIHPSLLPAFPGVDAQGQAYRYGVKLAGATVHFVDSGTDTGAIILQGATSVASTDSLDDLKSKILAIEHSILPKALSWAISGDLDINGRSVHHKKNKEQWVYSVS